MSRWNDVMPWTVDIGVGPDARARRARGQRAQRPSATDRNEIDPVGLRRPAAGAHRHALTADVAAGFDVVDEVEHGALPELRLVVRRRVRGAADRDEPRVRDQPVVALRARVEHVPLAARHERRRLIDGVRDVRSGRSRSARFAARYPTRGHACRCLLRRFRASCSSQRERGRVRVLVLLVAVAVLALHQLLHAVLLADLGVRSKHLEQRALGLVRGLVRTLPRCRPSCRTAAATAAARGNRTRTAR